MIAVLAGTRMANELVLKKTTLPQVWAIPKSIASLRGRNRAIGRVSQIDVEDDLAAIDTWLERNIKSKETYASYRKEAIRFMLWSVHALRKPISDLTHEDILLYENFIENPQPSSKWVNGERKLSMSHPEWRPFCGPLSKASQNQAMNILNSMFNWFVKAGYFDGNPISLVRKRTVRSGNDEVERYLEVNDLAMLMEKIRDLPGNTIEEIKKKARLRWIFSLLFLTGLRISEAVKNTMGGFMQRKDPEDGQLKWWLKVTGKGNKIAKIPATPELMEELAVYRETFGLPRLPTQGECIPLVFSLGPKRSAMRRQNLHKVLKDFIVHVADDMKKAGQEDESKWLLQVSAHWLRHSLASNLVNQGMKLGQVRDIMRHENLGTTNRYVHTEANERHGEMVKKHKLPGKGS